jgi:hypothetical protein
MGRLHEIRLKSNQFVENMNANIEGVILFAENQVLDLTRDRLEYRQENSQDGFMPEYSSKWKSIKGLTYWNLLQTGDLFNKLFINIKYPKYIIGSKSKHSDKIQNRVAGDIKESFYAISPKDQPEAKKITFKSFVERYKSMVLK